MSFLAGFCPLFGLHDLLFGLLLGGVIVAHVVFLFACVLVSGYQSVGVDLGVGMGGVWKRGVWKRGVWAWAGEDELERVEYWGMENRFVAWIASEFWWVRWSRYTPLR